jgi:hypothetical protein
LSRRSGVIGHGRIRDHKVYGVVGREVVVIWQWALQLGFRIGKVSFERYIRNGAGALTDVDLPGNPRTAKTRLSVACGDVGLFPGQGIGVTPLQLLTAVSSIANGGYLVKHRAASRYRGRQRSALNLSKIEGVS